MKKLKDTQLILLSTAAGRENGSIMPLPETLNAPADHVRKATAALLKAGYAEEGEVTEAVNAWRQEGETKIGIRITDAGRAAIGVGEPHPASGPASVAVTIDTAAPKKQTKAAMVLGMLRDEEGATLAELVTATGWLPHTTRAALTRLRKKNHNIEKGKRGEETLYRIVSAA